MPLKDKQRRQEYNRAYNETHKLELAVRRRSYYLAHRTEHYIRNRQWAKAHKGKVKLEVLTYYGNGRLACVQCGFKDIRALSIDHMNGGGSAHRRRVGNYMYAWLKRNNFPEGYQTLCMNCQWIKR